MRVLLPTLRLLSHFLINESLWLYNNLDFSLRPPVAVKASGFTKGTINITNTSVVVFFFNSSILYVL